MLATANTANRGIAAELYAKNGFQTIGIATTIDNYNTTASAGINMYGMYLTIRELTGTSNTDYSNGIVIDNNVTGNNAEHKSGLIANIGANTSSITNTLTTSGCNLTAVSYNGTIYGGKFEAVRVGAGTGSSYGVWASAPAQACSQVDVLELQVFLLVRFIRLVLDI